MPSGELGDDDIVCQLVYLPDRPEYWQAFLGALSYMATWRAWERDDDKRGKDAAANWREAFELTMECWRMTCLEQLQADVAAILAIMEIPQSCCDAGDVTDGDQYTDRVEDSVGDVPQNIIDAGYAEDAADWDGFDDYKCMIAHVIVDQLVGRLNEISPLVSATGGVLGGVAALAGILAVIFGTGGLAIVFGIVAGIGATSLLYQAITDFDLIDGLADKVDEHHDKLACSVYNADGDDAALLALNAEIDNRFTVAEALLLKNMNLGPTLKALYAGRYDQQDIADILEAAGYETGDFTCDCELIGDDLDFTDFETGTLEFWGQVGGEVYEDPDWSQGGGDFCFMCQHGQGDELAMWFEHLYDKHDMDPQAGDWLELHRFSFWRHNGADVRANITRLDFEHDGGTYEWNVTPMVNEYTKSEKIFSPPLICEYGMFVVQIYFWGPFSASSAIDSLTIDYTAHKA